MNAGSSVIPIMAYQSAGSAVIVQTQNIRTALPGSSPTLILKIKQTNFLVRYDLTALSWQDYLGRIYE